MLNLTTTKSGDFAAQNFSTFYRNDRISTVSPASELFKNHEFSLTATN